MKINSLTLKSYGKFNERKIEFRDGLNIIYGPNGTGKTTVSTALKSFLYKDTRGGGKYKKSYIPMGEKKGAYDVSFETDNGEKYISCVIAGETAGKSVARTVKLSDNREVASGVEIGEYFLGASEEFYDSVCFIKDTADFRKVSENSISVNEKLSASTVSERSSADVSEAINQLYGELLAYSRKTASGLIYPKECELYETENSLMQLKELVAEEKHLSDSMEKIKETAENKLKERKRLIALREEQEKYEEHIKEFGFESGSEKELIKRLEELEYEPEILSAEDEKILKELPQGKVCGLKALWAVAVFGVLLCLAGLVIPFVIYPGILSVAAAVISILFVNSNNRKVREKEAKLNIRKKEILESVSCQSEEEYWDKLKKIREDEAERKVIKRELERIRSLSSVKNAFSFLKKPEGSYSQTVKELEKINEEIAELKIEFNSIAEKKKSLFNNLPAPDELLKRKEKLEKEIEKLRYEEEITAAARNALEHTNEVYKSSYIPFVSKRAEEILLEVEKNIADKLILDEKFSPSLREKNDIGIKDEEHLSSGISDSVYFAVRLAVCEFAFAGKETPVLILDDPFVRMDDERAACWMRFLEEKKDIQIIFFTSGERNFKLGLENTTRLGL